MGVLGRHCHLLQEFNVTGSNRVTDEGILAFLGVGSRESKATILFVHESIFHEVHQK